MKESTRVFFSAQQYCCGFGNKRAVSMEWTSRHDPGWEEGKISGCGSGGGVSLSVSFQLVTVFITRCSSVLVHKCVIACLPDVRGETLD